MTAASEVERVLRGAGLSDNPGEFDSDIHSWRCSYPDIYGPCSCFQELASELAAVVGRHIPREPARIAETLDAEIRPLISLDEMEGGYDCCGCSTYGAILDHAIRVVRGASTQGDGLTPTP